MSRCVIIGGAKIENYDKIKSYFDKNDYFVFCDSGLKHQEKLGVTPDFIVGDFDSIKKPETDENILVLPTVKDDTDTFAAVKLMLKKGYESFLLVGVIGQRFDHSLGNISILLYLKQNGAKGIVVDDYCEMSIIDKKEKVLKNSCSYFSLISLTKSIDGVNIVGAKYPLENATIENSYQFGISNEAINDTEISVEKGDALLIKVF